MKNPNRRFVTLGKAAMAVAVVFLYRSAQAQLFEEGFNYTAGGSLSGNGPWTGGTANLTINNANLTYPGVPDLGGNSLSVVSGSGTASSTVANFTSTPITTGSIYYSFLAQCTTLPTGNVYLTSILPSAAAGPNGGSDPLSVYVGQQTAGSTFRFGIRSGGSGATYANNANFTAGAVNFFVVEYTFGGNVSLWVDPTTGGSQPTPDVSFAAGTAAANLQEIGFKAQSASTVGNWNFDDLRVGTAWADVTPAPEPSTIALAGLGLLGLAARFRKAKRG